MRRILCAILFAFCYTVTANAQLLRVDQFPGADVGTKATNAQKSCQGGFTCILYIPPEMFPYPTGTLPTIVSGQFLWDNRLGPFGNFSAQVQVTDAASIQLPVDASAFVTDFFINLNQNTTISAVSGGPFYAGREIVITLVQDATGNRSVTWPANFINTPTVQLGANSTTAVTFQYCGGAGNGAACPASDWQNTDVSPTLPSTPTFTGLNLGPVGCLHLFDATNVNSSSLCAPSSIPSSYINTMPGGLQQGQVNTSSAGLLTFSGDCTSSASPAVCGSANTGSAVIAAAATTIVVNTTAVTANAKILVSEDQSLGTKLSVTCNTQSSLVVGSPSVSARVVGTSFTILLPVAPTTNPLCLNWTVIP